MSYQGNTITIPLGEFGLLTDRPPSQIPPNAFVKANNITLETGMVEKAPGSLRYNSAALSGRVVGLIDYWPDSVKQRLIVATDDGKLWRDIGDRTFSGTTAIKTGLGALNPNCFFVEGGQEVALNPKKLFFFSDGLSQVQVLEGDQATVSTIDAPAVDWVTPNFPKFGLIHRNRLWAFQGQRAYASQTGDHEDFTSDFLTQNIYPGEGDEIKGAYVFKGRLFAFKDGGFVYYLDDAAADSSTWFWRKLGSNFGLAGPHGILDALDDMLAANTTGTVTSYKATEALGDIESADLFRAAEIEDYIRGTLSKSGLSEMHSLYYAEKKQAFFTYRTTYTTNNDALICFDMNKGAPRVTIHPKGTPLCLALRKDLNKINRPMYGDADGYVQLMDYEDRLEDTTAYLGEFQTPYMDFRFADQSLAHKQKHFDFLAIEFKEQGPHNVSVDVFIDERFVETLTFAQSISGTELGIFLLDTDYLGGLGAQTLTKRLRASGRRISFRFYNSGSNESFQIASFSVGFRAGGEAATKF